MDGNTIVVEDFYTLLSPLLTRQSISKVTRTLNKELEEKELINIYWAFHPQKLKYTFPSSLYRIISRIEHIEIHKQKYHTNYPTIPQIHRERI